MVRATVFPEIKGKEKLSDHLESSPRLDDPQTCGEDLPGNLKRLITIAPQYCDRCEDYHIATAAKRLSGETIWARDSREFLFGTLGPIFTEFAQRNKEIDVVIAACADTGVVATVAHAALAVDPTLVDRLRFTILDRCRSPLVLCEEFANRHQLKLRTATVDLLDPSNRFTADLIVMNNFLPFVPEDRHLDLMHNLTGWLKKNGSIVLWQPVRRLQGDSELSSTRAGRFDGVKAMVNAGDIEVDEPKAVFFARLDRAAKDQTPTALPSDTNVLSDLFSTAGLKVSSILEHTNKLKGRYSRTVATVIGRDRQSTSP